MSLTKEELIDLIDRAFRVEEDTSQDIVKYIISSCQWMNIAQDKKDYIVNVLQRISRESDGHGKLLMRLKNRVLQENKDVY